jgi:hypothetical protein
MYKQLKDPFGNLMTSVIFRVADNAFIPFDPANTDYAEFKRAVMADEVQLQDAEGVTMSPDAAKQFVATLP